ncbi:Protein kinase domain [Macleaya cordata]|uniref:Protein kinase domain n=1 Tax=Macleaya cordata TaxID=56857 RepID=A0A200R7P3_MACCD|nr:Protein kinase domain [Macleaya cordata]
MVAQISTVKFVILLLLFQWTSGQLVRLSSRIERAALFELRSSLGLRSRDWPRKSDPCLNWIGVQCRTDGRVIGINISGLRRTRLGRLNPQFSVDSLSNFTLLTSFNASGFLLPGSIPDWFGEKLSSLQVLDLRSCSVTDPIPFLLGNLTNLSSLYLSGNGITGIIPETLGQLSKLSILDLSQNLITGSIPSSFGSLTNLTVLDLSSNFLSGPIPPSIGILRNLLFLNLSNNSLSASIPAQLGDLSRLVDLDLSINSLSGSLPLDLRGLRSLKKMMVGHNYIAGVLPENLFSSLTQLQIVVLSQNNLSGALPDLFWSMPELLFLDVSYNNFTGILPNRSLNENAGARVFNLSNNQLYGTLDSNLGSFSFIDLSVNYFEGKVAGDNLKNSSLMSNCLQNVSNQRSLEDCTLFYTDRGLIFDNFGLPNTTQPPTPKSGRKSNKKLIFILVGVLGGVCFIVLLVLVLVLCLRKRERGVADQTRGSNTPPPVGSTPGPSSVSKDFSSVGEVFTYEQLLRATGDFSDSNLIKHGHSGDLFRGVLEGGTLVVIKRIDVRLMKKDSYMVELEFFSRVSHARLVPFLGHCLGHENEKLLVYKYMPNGDLCTSLYRKTSEEDDSLQTLDWITRLKVAIGAAEGLSYLHHECSPPLVHRDVQASSILLDDKFEVRLGSLSEICAQEGDIHHSVITRFLRLPQSSEQGSSGSLSATCAYDVYCFGKVLLELVTGKLGISSSNDATTNEWLEHTLPYISIYEKELVTKIVDSSLIIDEDLLEEVWAMAIVAKSCLNPKPSKRPLMRYVLKALENPLKVVREENTGSARLRTTSSRGSWNASVFGSWRHSSSDITGAPGPTITKEGVSGLKQLGTIGSQGSGQCGAGDLSSSNKKLSSDIFPEPSDLPDIERPREG